MELCHEFSVKLSQNFSGKMGSRAGCHLGGCLGGWMVVVVQLGGLAVGCLGSFTLTTV